MMNLLLPARSCAPSPSPRPTSAPSRLILICPFHDNLRHRVAKMYGRMFADGRLKPSGIDRAGVHHFRCVVCGHHVAV